MEPTETPAQEDETPAAESWPPGSMVRPDPFDFDFEDEHINSGGAPEDEGAVDGVPEQ